ncbi:MAG: prepilin-type N-terminal cleavage/methylation domain-containing protein [Oligoflexia bacterium]|nr:prepilin-type N-terminal cleavage/methylation domain-containing protein [Oligoflexia bacterium]
MDIIATSQARICKKSGFSLVEILVVLVLIALVVSVGGPRLLKTFGSPSKKIVRNLVVLTKQIHNSAKLKNRTYRIVIEFQNLEKKIPQRFYVESAGANYLVEPVKDQKYKRSIIEKDEESPFSPDASIMKKPIELPKGINFLAVETENYEAPVTEGKAYVHFFPQGLIERSIIKLIDSNKKETSLIINPLTGRVDVIEGNVQLRDIIP